MSQQILDEIRKIPPVTRFLCISTLAVTIPTMMELISIYPILFVRQYVVQKFQIWRIPLSFLHGGSGIGFIFDMIMLYRNSDGLESVQYSRRSYDYAWQLLLASVGILLINLPLNTYIHFRPLLVTLVYLSSALDPNAIVSIFGLLQLPAKYFPYFMVAMDLLTGAGMRGALKSFTGIIIGHAWFVLEHHQRGGTRWGRAPGFMRDLVGPGASGGPGMDPRNFGGAQAPSGRTMHDGGNAGAARATGYQWGSGQRLGTD